MQGIEFYLIQPTPVLRQLVDERPGDIGDLMVEPTLLHSDTRQPAYPRDDYDREAYVKIVFLAAMHAEYSGDPEFFALWGRQSPRTIAEFDQYWTLAVLSHENFAAFEQDAARAPEVLAAGVPTGSAAVDEALVALGRSGGT